MLLGAPQYITDSGRITVFYTYSDQVAIHLDGGFPNAVASGTCPTASGYYAGNSAPTKAMLAALLSARLTGAKVSMTLSGCDGNGGWLKFSDVYIVE